MSKSAGFMRALKCRECGREYPLEATHVCEFDFGPLEVAYDYDKIRKSMTKAALAKRPETMWRFRELLPVADEPTVGTRVGYTPLVKADRLAKWLGVREAWVKNDAVNYPTLSFKDRVVSVALSRSRELGFETVACASTGNLANSVAANAASAGLDAVVFIPADLEEGKILNSLIYGARVVGIRGHYDEVNRLCAEIAGKYGWAFVNVNMRPYYAEGSKSMAYEIAEQLNWKLPQHTVVPMASGSLLTKIHKGYQELIQLGLTRDSKPTVHGAQATGCSPISAAYKQGMDFFKPVKPDTIAKSLAIGTPADGFYALKVMKETGGASDDVSDDEIREAMSALAECEGIFTETAGGVTVGTAKKLVASGKIPAEDSVVLCVTGNGLKTLDAVQGHVGKPAGIKPSLREFEQLMEKDGRVKSK
ncbi:MAG: threonine synthase [Verrucomicrobiales bacterium]|jgi:threonine synthase|nr:threonine synthase [Verrucomicrobiales bacterium]MDP6678964.1 threonine synthase [Verrucomicrobiota bacterium]MDP6753500.1 threonine synthase [Verrucomicrobiota bacterium]MDP7013693.1 threonine synthase [Verrucomicrobiota bacterium]